MTMRHLGAFETKWINSVHERFYESEFCWSEVGNRLFLGQKKLAYQLL